MGNLIEAVRRFEVCIEFNRTYNFQENLIRNYLGLATTYDSLENFRQAKRYYKQHYELQDSLIGAEKQLQIAQLKADYESKKQEVEIERNRKNLLQAQQLLERRASLIGFLILLGIIFLVWWVLKRRQVAKEIQQNRDALRDMTKMLIDKNKKLAELEHQLTFDQQSSTTNDSAIQASLEADLFEGNLYDQRILTAEDWTAFKVYFEKSYPKYLFHLRNEFPNLTEAEERIFLFIKLNLTTAEIANILGIFPSSVKKNRYRLRKRLGLDTDDSLDNFIQNFLSKKKE